MERVSVRDYRVLVLAEGETVSAVSNAKGHLFEEFIARLLHIYGFDAPTESNVNVTSDGIELDVVIGNKFTKQTAIAEGKAYSTGVRAQAFTSFYGKLNIARFEDRNTHGYLFALPRLVANGHEQARLAESNDAKFHYLDAHAVVECLVDRKLIRTVEAAIPSDLTVSDPAIIISAEGLYVCVKELKPETRLAERVLVWGQKIDAPVPVCVVDLLLESDYAADCAVQDLQAYSRVPIPTSRGNLPIDSSAPIVVSVRGSSSDFEYQFPASPAFFVGRRDVVGKLDELLDDLSGTFVLNAQSGWGKSSLALKMKTMAEKRGGYALVVDSRTASSPSFVVEALRVVSQEAEEHGLIKFSENYSWASIKSAVDTIGNSEWMRQAPLLIFFDQFENVFQDEVITREFRDLAFLVNELKMPLIVGFAWKTDLVGWTESHPYRLRDEIRSVSTNISVDPMGARDIEALMRRLEKHLRQPLTREFRQRLREYSQGLPWLFKKLAGHAIREIEENGKTQEQLVNEALNVQSLFDSDLAGLQPLEKDAIRHVARFAPVSAAEVTDKYEGAVIQSLLDRRLIVAVGEKLDTYWDTFRDFLNTGKVPIEDSYTIGLNPQSMAPVLSFLLANGGESSNSEIAAAIGSNIKSVQNTSRILKLLGITTGEPNRVKLADGIADSPDPEARLRRIALQSLRRNKAYSLFAKLAERHGDSVSLATLSLELPGAFPAVEAKPNTWGTYARAFALWFTYSGIALLKGTRIYLPPEGFTGKGNLITEVRTARGRSKLSDRAEHIHVTAGPVLKLLLSIQCDGVQIRSLSRRSARVASTALLLGLAEVDDSGLVTVCEGSLSGVELNPRKVHEGLGNLKGGELALQALAKDPAADLFFVGSIIRDAAGAEWKDTTTQHVGKYFRTWAKHAGIDLPRARHTGSLPSSVPSGQTTLL
ncbi:nSTAND1 domain-containing NTPase [Nocardia farcinica]|uniref:nSTAND1 domain-containing NTPase n=1 Tax=Nocardia farcinica TaxID=37329 RepID=UPI0018930CC9|nr:hypothetical protein [Nocardia farcinica]MBF6067788.1 hypothetical protein [Nocardia farcinica]